MNKVYVTVVEMTKDGKILPRVLQWTDGRAFVIDRIIDVRRSGIRYGGYGICYKCIISKRECELYLENGKPLTLPGGQYMREFPGSKWFVFQKNG